MLALQHEVFHVRHGRVNRFVRLPITEPVERIDQVESFQRGQWSIIILRRSVMVVGVLMSSCSTNVGR